MLEMDSKGASPQQSGKAPRTESSRLSLATARRCGILVVDDEAGMRGVLNIALRQQGFAVWLAADGRQALDLYRNHRSAIDVVVMDVRMPGLDGPQTLALLQQLNPRICCRFMSGDLGRYLEWQLSNLSSAAVIRKPFRLPEVAQMLWKLAAKVNWIKAGNLESVRKGRPRLLPSHHPM